MIEEAIKKYNFVNPTSRFVRHNENMTYCITDDNGQFVIRIHKPSNGFSVDFLRLGVAQNKFVESEMEVLTYLENTSQLVLYGELFQCSKVRLNYLDLLCFIHDILI